MWHLETVVTAGKAKWQCDAVTKRDAVDGVQNLDIIPRTIRPGTKLAEIVVNQSGQRV